MAKWPEKLMSLVEVIEVNLQHFGLPDAHEKAVALAIEVLDCVVGGDNQYMPKADKLKAFMRDEAIWDEFNGLNKEALARKYRVSVRHIEILVASRQKKELESRQKKIL